MIQLALDHETLRLGVVRARGVRVEPSPPGLLNELSALETALRTEPTRFPEPVRARIRDVLRKGGYKPTGRGKPASEFLLGAALGEGLPRINNLVDINNVASLESAFPISIFDVAKLGEAPSVRFGRAGESYVFNASGQTMDITGLPVVCRGDEPVGNAVKDSMLTKVSEQTRDVLLVVYGTSELPKSALTAACERLSALLRTYASAESVDWAITPEG